MSGIKLFNNLLVYRVCGPVDLRAWHIEEKLAERPARYPSAQELSTIGFVEPGHEKGRFVEPVNTQCSVIAVKVFERMLPAKIVRSEVLARVNKIETEEQRKVYAREKQQLKDAVISALLPQAFVDSRTVYAMILGPYIVVDASSVKRAEAVLDLLRDVLGSLPIRPVEVTGTPISHFTDWFTHARRLHHFELNGDFKANSQGDEFDFVNGKGTSPEDETLSDLVSTSNRRVTTIGLKHLGHEGEPVEFTVTEMLGIRGIKWPEYMLEQIDADLGVEEEDSEAQRVAVLRATFTLLAAAVHGLIQDLLLELGGEQHPDGDYAEEHMRQIDLLNGLFKRDLLQHLSRMGEAVHSELAKMGGRVVPAAAAQTEDDLI